MSACNVQASGTIELYFYGEIEGPERESVEHHLSACGECFRALEELRMIRAALSSRPVVAAPAGGDWPAFMARLDEAVVLERHARKAAGIVVPRRPAPRTLRYAPYVAVAALVTLVTMSVAYVTRTGNRSVSDAPVVVETAPPAQVSRETAFAQLSEQHFERSKLVVLGLVNRDPQQSTGADWQYERQLASNLLIDTRLYRQTAEERGMTRLARVMGDLELVLLHTSMAEEPDPDTLEHIQRLIRTRDLVAKMSVVTTVAGL